MMSTGLRRPTRPPPPPPIETNRDYIHISDCHTGDRPKPNFLKSRASRSFSSTSKPPTSHQKSHSLGSAYLYLDLQRPSSRSNPPKTSIEYNEVHITKTEALKQCKDIRTSRCIKVDGEPFHYYNDQTKTVNRDNKIL